MLQQDSAKVMNTTKVSEPYSLLKRTESGSDSKHLFDTSNGFEEVDLENIQ